MKVVRQAGGEQSAALRKDGRQLLVGPEARPRRVPAPGTDQRAGAGGRLHRHLGPRELHDRHRAAAEHQHHGEYNRQLDQRLTPPPDPSRAGTQLVSASTWSRSWTLTGRASRPAELATGTTVRSVPLTQISTAVAGQDV